MKREFARYPVYRNNYIRAFDRMLAARERKGLPTRDMWKDGESVLKWWIGDDPYQIDMFEEDEE